jgi:hypothetical protein
MLVLLTNIISYFYTVKTKLKTIIDLMAYLLAFRYSTHFPSKFCQRLAETEWDVLNQYHGSSSALGEALCTIDSNNVTTINPAIAQQIQMIHHLKDSSIALWLGESSRVYDWKENVERLLPIILEKNYDLAEAVDQALLYASSLARNLSRTMESFQDAADFEARHQRATCYELDSAKKALAVSHSAGAHHEAAAAASTGGGEAMAKSSQHTKSSLSRKAEVCLAEYYKRDYQILAELSQKCSTKICRDAIQSVLKRRDSVLPESVKEMISVTDS